MKSAFFHKEPVQLADFCSDKGHYGVMGECNLPVVFPLEVLSPNRDMYPLFRKGRPAICVVDDFYTNPEEIRKIALAQNFKEGPKNYKGKRTAERYLWAGLKEEFERLLGVHITDWLQQGANGVFQITGKDEPLVWHSDLQSYAAAIYLTPGAPLTAGTSFWRSKETGCRKPSSNEGINRTMYREFNLLNHDNWELVDRVGAVYNRLVLWDAALIHSATSYEGFDINSPETSRLVQLFFFSVKCESTS